MHLRMRCNHITLDRLRSWLPTTSGVHYLSAACVGCAGMQLAVTILLLAGLIGTAGGEYLFTSGDDNTQPDTIVSVRTFGAVGDDEHDDTFAFQQAIDRGGRIYVPFGTYKITDTLHLRHGAYLVGDGYCNVDVSKNSRLKFYGLGDKPAIVTRRDDAGGANSFGLEGLTIIPNSWDTEQGCTGNGLDIDSTIVCRHVQVLGFKRHNLFLHCSPGERGDGPYFSLFDTCIFDKSGSHGVVVGTLANAITFINCQIRWSGAPALWSNPTEAGQADGLIVTSSGAGNPDGQYRTYCPEQLQIFGGQSSYNSRYGYNFQNLHNSFVVTGYIEGNLSADGKQCRVGSGVLACQINVPHIARGAMLLETSETSLFTHPNAIWASGEFLGTGRATDTGRNQTPMLSKLRTHISGGRNSAVYFESDDMGNLVFGHRGLVPTIFMHTNLRVGVDGNGGNLTSTSIQSRQVQIDVADPANPDTTYAHQALGTQSAQLMYRGTIRLDDGQATVNLDTAAGLPAGTFDRISSQPQVFLQNLTGWEPLRGVFVDGGSLRITSQNTSDDNVGWMVVADRVCQ